MERVRFASSRPTPSGIKNHQSSRNGDPHFHTGAIRMPLKDGHHHIYSPAFSFPYSLSLYSVLRSRLTVVYICSRKPTEKPFISPVIRSSSTPDSVILLVRRSRTQNLTVISYWTVRQLIPYSTSRRRNLNNCFLFVRFVLAIFYSLRNKNYVRNDVKSIM